MHKSNIAFDPAWVAGKAITRERGRALLGLLGELERSASLREAARAAGISYRFAWGTLGEAATVFGGALVHLQQGRGATLTPLGRKVVELDRRVRAELGPHFERLRGEIAAELASASTEPRVVLTLHASHDLALAALPALCGPRLDLRTSFRGADECLAALSRGTCDLAGFHVPDALPRAAAVAAALGKWLDPRKHTLLHLVTREQGLIVRPGSRIRGVHDLARPGVRFIHRQSDGDESIAAAVAAERADAGFGLRADAARHKLAFVRLATERYFIACARSAIRGTPMQRLLEVLRSEPFAAMVSRLPGYDGSKAGQQEPLDAALTWVEA